MKPKKKKEKGGKLEKRKTVEKIKKLGWGGGG